MWRIGKGGAARPREARSREAAAPFNRRSRLRSTRLDAERGNESVNERATPFLERDHRGEDFLLAFDDESIGLEHALDRVGDLPGGEPVGAFLYWRYNL